MHDAFAAAMTSNRRRGSRRRALILQFFPMTTCVSFLRSSRKHLPARGALVGLPVALAAVFGAAVHAQPVSTLAETVVTATRVEQPLTDLVGDISIVDRASIERSGATGVADVLARLPGIEMVRNGGVGGTTSVYIRGAESRFTAVYIDGVRIDSQSTGGATWESIPLSQIDRIEVLRGPAAAVYGSDAVGGVIQLFTRRGEAGVSPSVGVGIGSHNLKHLEAGVSGATGGFDYSLGIARDSSDGINASVGPDFNPDRDGYRSASANARLGFQINPQQRLEATVLTSSLNAAYDAFGYDPTAPVDDRSKYRLNTAGLTWTSQWTDVWKTRIFMTDSSSRYATEPSFYLTETKLRGYLFQNEFRLGAGLFTAALERREDALTNAPGVGLYGSPGLHGDRSQNALALGYNFVQGPHAIQVNVRRDDDSEFGGRDTGSLAYGYSLTSNWRATASVGTAFRAPTLYQRYSEYGVAGLKPEESRNAEVGLRYTDVGTTAGVVVYRNKVRNLIDFDYGSTACQSLYGCFANTTRAQYQGVTLSGSQKLSIVTLRGSIDFQDPRNLDTDTLLVQRSRRHASLGADVRFGTWTLGAEVQASGVRYANDANTQSLHGYGLVNLSASVPLTQLSPGLTFIARIDNLTDRDYQLIQNYTTLGRTFYAGLKWSPR